MTRADLEAAIARAQDAKHDARSKKAKQKHAREVARLCVLVDVYDAVLSMLESYTRYNVVDLHDPKVRLMMASDALNWVA